MKSKVLSIAIMMVIMGLSVSPVAMARDMRGGAMSHRPGVEMRGPVHGPRVNNHMARPVPVNYGMRVATRPVGVSISFGGVNFIYDNGIFYNTALGGWEVIRPRVGMIVPSLPTGYSVVMRNGVRHYAHNGVLYSPVHSTAGMRYRVAGFL